MSDSETSRQRLLIGAGCLMMGIMIGASLTQLRKPPKQDIDPSLLSYHGLDYTLSKLPVTHINRITALRCTHAETLNAAVIEAGWQLYLIDLAQKQQLNLAQAETLALTIETVSDAEIDALYTAHQNEWKQPLFVIREGLRTLMTEVRQRRAKHEKLVELQRTGELILLTPPSCDKPNKKSEHPLT